MGGSVSILSGGAELLERVRPLWLRLRAHHADISPTWRESLLRKSFESRKDGLLAKAAPDGLLVLIVVRGPGPEPVGYCVATVAPDGSGEIDSLYVEPAHRRQGIGQGLVSHAMVWLRARST